MAKAPSDFNDLYALAGLDAVRQQLLAALDTPPLDEVKPEPALPASETSPDPSAPPDDAPPLEADAVDELYNEAVQFVCETRRASISAVQRKLRIGYNRAARLIEAMEAAGVISPMRDNGSREVLAPLGGPRVDKQISPAVDDSPSDSPGPLDAAPSIDPFAADFCGPPAPPLEDGGRFSLPELLQRFSLTVPKGKIWDGLQQRFVNKGVVRDWFGAKLYNEWMEHPKRATVEEDEVRALAAAAQIKGRGDLSDALNRYFYIEPTLDAWDAKRRERVPMSALKLAIAGVYDMWLKHPNRRDIFTDDLVFDPTGPYQQAGRINTFRGLPLEAIDKDGRCKGILELVFHVVNGDWEVYHWLMRWLALPLQRVGTKMASAVLAHSEMQGSGKSLLFDNVMRPIYGEYSSTLGQHQLESSYTDWRSQLLYGVFEEIFSRESKYSHTGTMKQMITGATQRIEKKFVSGWEEANYMNGAFLSNEIQPFPIEPSDRRMLVIWPEKKLPEDIKKLVLEEIAGDGIAAFYGVLKRFDLGDFHTHTEPVMTEAKERLIDYSRYSWDLFHRDWKHERTPWPYRTCLLSDLYRCYRAWCKDMGENSLTLNKFSSNIMTRELRRRDVIYIEPGCYDGTRKGTILQIGSHPEGGSQKEWVGVEVKAFAQAMQALKSEPTGA